MRGWLGSWSGLALVIAGMTHHHDYRCARIAPAAWTPRNPADHRRPTRNRQERVHRTR